MFAEAGMEDKGETEGNPPLGAEEKGFLTPWYKLNMDLKIFPVLNFYS